MFIKVGVYYRMKQGINVLLGILQATFAGDIANWTTVVEPIWASTVTAVKTTNWLRQLMTWYFVIQAVVLSQLHYQLLLQMEIEVNITDVANSFSFTNYLRIDSGANSINNGASPFDLVIVRTEIKYHFVIWCKQYKWVFIDVFHWCLLILLLCKAKVRGLEVIDGKFCLPVRWDTIECRYSWSNNLLVQVGNLQPSWRILFNQIFSYIYLKGTATIYVYKNGSKKIFSIILILLL